MPTKCLPHADILKLAAMLTVSPYNKMARITAAHPQVALFLALDYYH